MVDESDRGIAFLTRVSDPPRPGDALQAAPERWPSGFASPLPRGVIRRVESIQSGVLLIAAELFPAEQRVVTRAVRRRTAAA